MNIWLHTEIGLNAVKPKHKLNSVAEIINQKPDPKWTKTLIQKMKQDIQLFHISLTNGHKNQLLQVFKLVLTFN